MRIKASARQCRRASFVVRWKIFRLLDNEKSKYYVDYVDRLGNEVTFANARMLDGFAFVKAFSTVIMTFYEMSVDMIFLFRLEHRKTTRGERELGKS